MHRTRSRCTMLVVLIGRCRTHRIGRMDDPKSDTAPAMDSPLPNFAGVSHKVFQLMAYETSFRTSAYSAGVALCIALVTAIIGVTLLADPKMCYALEPLSGVFIVIGVFGVYSRTLILLESRAGMRLSKETQALIARQIGNSDDHYSRRRSNQTTANSSVRTTALSNSEPRL